MSFTAIGGHGKFSVPEKFLILENFLAPSSIAPGQFLLPPGNAVPPIPLVFPDRTASAILEMVFHLFHWCWQPGQFLWCFTYTPLVFLCLPPGNAVPPLFHWYSQPGFANQFVSKSPPLGLINFQSSGSVYIHVYKTRGADLRGAHYIQYIHIYNMYIYTLSLFPFCSLQRPLSHYILRGSTNLGGPHVCVVDIPLDKY